MTVQGALGDSNNTDFKGKALSADNPIPGKSGKCLGWFDRVPVNEDELYEGMELSATPAISVTTGSTKSIVVIATKGGSVYEPYDATSECTFTSATTSKVTVSADGVVTGVAATSGTPVDVTATWTKTGQTAVCKVTVTV
jgi:hypothetical protein